MSARSNKHEYEDPKDRIDRILREHPEIPFTKTYRVIKRSGLPFQGREFNLTPDTWILEAKTPLGRRRFDFELKAKSDIKRVNFSFWRYCTRDFTIDGHWYPGESFLLVHDTSLCARPSCDSSPPYLILEINPTASSFKLYEYEHNFFMGNHVVVRKITAQEIKEEEA